jgi:hypothetical protein
MRGGIVMHVIALTRWRMFLGRLTLTGRCVLMLTLTGRRSLVLTTRLVLVCALTLAFYLVHGGLLGRSSLWSATSLMGHALL